MLKYRMSPVAEALNRRKVLGLSLGSAMVLLSSAQAYAACFPVNISSTLVGTTDCIDWSAGDFNIVSESALISTGTPPLAASSSAGSINQ